MLHRLDNTCTVDKNDLIKMLHLFKEKRIFANENFISMSLYEQDLLCKKIEQYLNKNLDGWVAVPHVAEKKQLKGNTHCEISLGRWQAILALSPEIPTSNS